jgi:hypothetical protein
MWRRRRHDVTPDACRTTCTLHFCGDLLTRSTPSPCGPTLPTVSTLRSESHATRTPIGFGSATAGHPSTEAFAENIDWPADIKVLDFAP